MTRTRNLAATATAALAFLTVVPLAAAYDRAPIRLTGLTPDTWGQTVTTAESQLRGRFPGIRTATCFPVIVAADPSDSSFVLGTTRYWDKLACGGSTWSGHGFALVYDAKGRHSWVIYRLRGVTIAALRG
ncbi:MAG TPA: hypothetical protein VFB42_00695 [Gaiellaceae bacterium]|nr:hypothetical protein [Gaiellaceae bacterium]